MINSQDLLNNQMRNGFLAFAIVIVLSCFRVAELREGSPLDRTTLQEAILRM